MKTKAHSHNRFMRIITLPIRFLGKAKDLYVKSLTDCAARGYGNNMGGPAGMPRSFSYASSRSQENEDFRELMRAASANALGSGVDLHTLLQQAALERSRSKTAAVPRSCSVGMTKIDEDGPCEFGEVNFTNKADLMYPRSRSYAVPKRSGEF